AQLADTVFDEWPVAGIESLRLQLEHALERCQVLSEGAWLIVDDDAASASHQVAGEERALGRVPEAQALAGVARGFEGPQRPKAHLLVGQRPVHAGQIGMAGELSAGARAEWQRGG